jgi:glycosyltransferase involved in cell wall biosynthesis
MSLDRVPLVSIITPVHNGARYLDELIKSVLQQNYPNIEHIVIDDGSEDGSATVNILNRYSHLRWWSRENKGQYATMNEGLQVAQGEVVCFVSADDVVSKCGVTLAMGFLARYSDFDGVFGLTNYIDMDGNPYPYPLPFRKAPLLFYPYFAHISHCSLYVKRSSLQKHGLFFNPSLRLVGDYEWMIRMQKCGLRIGMIDQELSSVRVHDSQASQKYQDASRAEAKEVIKTQHINRLLHFFLSSIYLIQVWTWKIFRIMGKTVL